MTRVVIYNSGSTQKPFSVALTVLSEALRVDDDVTLLDIEDFVYIRQGLPPNWFIRPFGFHAFPERFRKKVQELGGKYVMLKESRQKNAAPSLPADVELELEQAIESDLFTYLRTDNLNDFRILAKITAKRLRNPSQHLYWRLQKYLEQSQATTVYIPNGRVAHQRVSLLAAKNLGLSVIFYENGRAVPNSAYIGNCQVHDRQTTQVEARTLASQTSRAELRESAKEWLQQRTKPSSSLNPYSKTWNSVTPQSGFPAQIETTLQAAFFTSSADEFSSYGRRWAGQSWVDQFEAFDVIMHNLNPSKIACILRVHPALANKTPKYFRRELNRISDLVRSYPSLKVVWPNQPLSSYEIMGNSDYVFVGRSTLGLEASLLGKAVWTTTPARYDDIADVRKLHHREDVTEDSLELWGVNPAGAEALIHYWVSQDIPFVCDESLWYDWDTSAPPLVVRIGNIFVPNSLVHRLFLLYVELNAGLQKRKRKYFLHQPLSKKR